MKKKSDLLLLEIYKAFLTIKLSQYSKSESTISSSKPVSTHSYCHRLGDTLCLCSPVHPPKLCRCAAPRARPLILILSSGIASGSDCQMTCRDSNLDSYLNSASLPTGYKGLSAQKSQNKLRGV